MNWFSQFGQEVDFSVLIDGLVQIFEPSSYVGVCSFSETGNFLCDFFSMSVDCLLSIFAGKKGLRFRVMCARTHMTLAALFQLDPMNTLSLGGCA